MSMYPINTESEIAALHTRINRLEQQLAAMQADIAAAKGEPEKAVEKVRELTWVNGREAVIEMENEGRVHILGQRENILKVAAALNAREVKP